VNAVTAVVGGLGVLGLWTLASRLIQVPILAFTSLYTVGFPAMSNLLAGGEDPGPVILRTTRRAAMTGALVFPPFAAGSLGLVPAVFGARWQDAAYVLPWIALSTLILSSISVGVTSFLAASGRPGRVAYAAALFGVTWIAVTAALLPVIGVSAIGVGNLAGGLAETFLLDRLSRRVVGVAPYAPLLRPVGVAVVAGAAGLAVYLPWGSDVLVGIAASGLAAVVSLVALRIVCADDLKDLVRLAVTTVRVVLPGHGSATVAET
jgi:hypothetical protein